MKEMLKSIFLCGIVLILPAIVFGLIASLCAISFGYEWGTPHFGNIFIRGVGIGCFIGLVATITFLLSWL